MDNEKGMTRRDFVTQTGRVAAGVGLGMAMADRLIVPAQAQTAAAARRAIGANDRIVLALIGAGGMGRGNMGDLQNRPNVEIAAVCDPDRNHMAQAAEMVEKKSGRRPAQLKDFRRVLDMKDVDGVIIATPDHWHALPMILACQAGKDVHQEKPISHNIWEGRQMANAAKRHGSVVQVNTWQRSTQHFVDAIDYARSGKLGKISIVRAWKTDNARVGQQQPKAPPAELDYELWVGPAAFEPYRENRAHYNWRWYMNYGSGMTGDWGVHMIDIAALGMSPDDDNLVMPTSVSSYGGKFLAPEDDRTAPDTHVALYEYPDFVMQWETHAGGYGMDGGGDHGAEFLGTNGRLMVDRGGWQLWDRDNKPMEKVASDRKVNDHNGNFLDCMRTRRQTRAPIESLHKTTTLCHLANLAMLAGHTIEWDAAREVVTNDRRAMDLLPYRRPYRKPWTLPTVKVS